MVLKINDAFLTVIQVTDENNNPSSGKTISYRIFDETHTLFASGTMTEIGTYGIYYVSWTPDTAGYWIFEAYYAGSDFHFYDSKSYQVQEGVEDAIEDRIKASPSVDSIFFKSGGALCPTSKSIWNALGDGTVSLNDLNADLDTIISELGDGSYGLAALEALLNGIGSLLIDADYGLSALNDDLDAIISELANATYGLSALDDDLDTLITDVSALQTDVGDFQG